MIQQISGFLAFFTTWLLLILCIKTGSWKMGREHALCVGTVLWLIVLFCGTEVLSLFQAVIGLSVRLLWIGVFLIEIIIAVAKRNRVSGIIRNWNLRWRKTKEVFAKDRVLAVGFLAIMVILIRSVVLAICTVPYNWDSMTYHLSRIMFWIEHRSVGYFETNIIRQTVSPVLPECINLHVILLTGGDACVNMLQCISSIGCTYLIYKLTRMIDCRRSACYGCLLLVTTNIFVAEAVTTQTDMVTAFVLLVAVYLMFIVIKKDQLVWSSDNILLFLLLGISCGLLYITKSNAALPAAILATFVVGYRLYRKDTVRAVISLGIISLISAAFVALPTFYRNVKYYNDFLASRYVSGILIGSWNPVYMVLNAIKNIGTVGVNRFGAGILIRIVLGLGKVLGVNINDPAISFNGIKYSIEYSIEMDNAGADTLILLGIVAFFLLLYRMIRHRKLPDILCFVLLLQMICSFTVIRWQPWVSRLLLPSLVLSCIPITYVFDNAISVIKTQKRRAVAIVFSFFFGGVLISSMIGMTETTVLQSRKALKNILQKQTRWELYFESRGGVERIKKFAKKSMRRDTNTLESIRARTVISTLC